MRVSGTIAARSSDASPRPIDLAGQLVCPYAALKPFGVPNCGRPAPSHPGRSRSGWRWLCRSEIPCRLPRVHHSPAVPLIRRTAEIDPWRGLIERHPSADRPDGCWRARDLRRFRDQRGGVCRRHATTHVRTIPNGPRAHRQRRVLSPGQAPVPCQEVDARAMSAVSAETPKNPDWHSGSGDPTSST